MPGMDHAHIHGHDETPQTRSRLWGAAVLAVLCLAMLVLWLRVGPSSSPSSQSPDDAAWWQWALGFALLSVLTVLAMGWGWRVVMRRNWLASRKSVQRLVDILDICFWQTNARHQLSLWRPPLNSPESIWEGAGLIGQPIWQAWSLPSGGVAENWSARLSAGAPLIDLRVRRSDRPDGPIWLLRGVARSDSLGRFAGYEGTLRLADPGAARQALPQPVPAWDHAAYVLDGIDGLAALISWRGSASEPVVLAMNSAAAQLLGSGSGGAAAVQALWRHRGAIAAQIDAAWIDAWDELKLRSANTLRPAQEVVIRRVCGSVLSLRSLASASHDGGDMEVALLRLERASVQEESAALDDHQAFSYAVSHDLRAPLRVVEGFARILKEDYGRLLDRVGNDHLERILGAGLRMNGMIDSLLEQAKLSTRPLLRQSINMSQLAAWVVDDLRRQHAQRNVDVQIDDGMMVEGDPVLLRALLENLLGNAWKYSAKRDPARIAFVRLAPDAQSGLWVYCVRDNGVGFDMRYADRLFGMFQRMHSASEYQGTGVGLASVRRIVRRHGGDIWAESAVDAGARFFFTLA